MHVILMVGSSKVVQMSPCLATCENIFITAAGLTEKGICVSAAFQNDKNSNNV